MSTPEAQSEPSGHEYRLDPEDTVGKYAVVEPIAFTNMSEVYSATNTYTGEDVALKIPLSSPMSRRMFQEIILHTQFSKEPSVVTIDGHGLSHGRPYVATSLQKNGTLEGKINTQTDTAPTTVEGVIKELEAELLGVSPYESSTIELDMPLIAEVKVAVSAKFGTEIIHEIEESEHPTVDEAVKIITDAAEVMGHEINPDSQAAKELALQVLKDVPHGERVPGQDVVLDRIRILYGVAQAVVSLNRKGVVHRDIKPSNVGITDSGEGVLMDFGIATKKLGYHPTTVGSLNTIPPEGFEGLVVPEGDRFALSATAYKALVGKFPWDAGDDEVRLYHAMHEKTPIHPSDINGSIPGALGSVLLRGLATDPRTRASDQELRDALFVAAG